MFYEPDTGLDARQLLVDRKFNVQELCSLASNMSDGHSAHRKLLHSLIAIVNIREWGMDRGSMQTEL